jgi:hypothetical protein
MDLPSLVRIIDSRQTSGFKGIKCVIDRFCPEVVCVGSERYVSSGSRGSAGQKQGITVLQMCQDSNEIQETVSFTWYTLSAAQPSVLLLYMVTLSAAQPSVLFQQISSFSCTTVWNASLTNQGQSEEHPITRPKKGCSGVFFSCPKRPDRCWVHPVSSKSRLSGRIIKLSTHFYLVQGLKYMELYLHLKVFMSCCLVTNIYNTMFFILQMYILSWFVTVVTKALKSEYLNS